MKDRKFRRVWDQIRQRCTNTKNDSYKYYWWKWVKVLWLSFQEFKHDMYRWYLDHVRIFGKENTSIDRKDSNGHYCKNNCKRSDAITQANNKYNNVRYNWVSIRRYCVENWKLSDYKTIMIRIKRLWWSIEKAINEPRQQGKWIIQQDLQWNKIAEFISLHEAWRKTGVHYSNISTVLSWRRKSTWWYKRQFLLSKQDEDEKKGEEN